MSSIPTSNFNIGAVVASGGIPVVATIRSVPVGQTSGWDGTGVSGPPRTGLFTASGGDKRTVYVYNPNALSRTFTVKLLYIPVLVNGVVDVATSVFADYATTLVVPSGQTKLLVVDAHSYGLLVESNGALADAFSASVWGF